MNPLRSIARSTLAVALITIAGMAVVLLTVADPSRQTLAMGGMVGLLISAAVAPWLDLGELA